MQYLCTKHLLIIIHQRTTYIYIVKMCSSSAIIIICLQNALKVYIRFIYMLHIVFEINFNKIQDFNPWPNVNRTWTYRISQKVHGTGHKWNLIWEWVFILEHIQWDTHWVCVVYMYIMCIGSSLSNVSNLLFDGTNTHMKLLSILWGFYILFYSVRFVFFFYAKPFEFWGNVHKSVYCITDIVKNLISLSIVLFIKYKKQLIIHQLKNSFITAVVMSFL